MLNQEEREIVEELTTKYCCSLETIALLLQQRRRLSSFSEKSAVLPNFLQLMRDVETVRKVELHRKAVNRVLDQERKREAGSVGEPSL